MSTEQRKAGVWYLGLYTIKYFEVYPAKMKKAEIIDEITAGSSPA